MKRGKWTVVSFLAGAIACSSDPAVDPGSSVASMGGQGGNGRGEVGGMGGGAGANLAMPPVSVAGDHDKSAGTTSVATCPGGLIAAQMVSDAAAPTSEASFATRTNAETGGANASISAESGAS